MMHDHVSVMVDDANHDDDRHLLLCSSSNDTGMVMYMEGFRWTLKGGGSCLNFFVASWKLNTVPRFVASMVVVLVLGIATEGIARWKHTNAMAWKKKQQTANNANHNNNNNNNRNRNRRRLRALQQACLQALSILLAYLLMLVVMTYSLELLLCVLGGLMVGYYVFDGDELHHGGGGSICCSFLLDNDDDEAAATAATGTTDSNNTMTEALLPRPSSDDTSDDDGVLFGSTRTRRTSHNGQSESYDVPCCNNNNNDGGDQNVAEEAI